MKADSNTVIPGARMIRDTSDVNSVKHIPVSHHLDTEDKLESFTK